MVGLPKCYCVGETGEGITAGSIFVRIVSVLGGTTYATSSLDSSIVCRRCTARFALDEIYL